MRIFESSNRKSKIVNRTSSNPHPLRRTKSSNRKSPIVNPQNNVSPNAKYPFNAVCEQSYGQMVLVPNAFGIAETKGQKKSYGRNNLKFIDSNGL
jgi:hypothetical protein